MLGEVLLTVFEGGNERAIDQLPQGFLGGFCGGGAFRGRSHESGGDVRYHSNPAILATIRTIMAIENPGKEGDRRQRGRHGSRVEARSILALEGGGGNG